MARSSRLGRGALRRRAARGAAGGSVLASLGCGNPIAVADLREGETVLDLGSGGGIDVILSAKRVGRPGLAYGLDMTDEMLALAGGTRRRQASERHLPQGRDRGDPAAGRLGRRRDLELRHQPLDGQAGGAGGDRPCVEARAAASVSATSSPTIASRSTSVPNAAATSAASRARSRRPNTWPDSRRRASSRSASLHLRGRRRDARRDREGREDGSTKPAGLPIIQPRESAGCC